MSETFVDLLHIVYGFATGRAGWLAFGVAVLGLIALAMLCVAFVRPQRALVSSSYGVFALVWTSGFAALAWHRGLLFATAPERNFDRAYEASLDRFHLLHLTVGLWGVVLSLAAIALALETRRFAFAAALLPFVLVGVAMVCSLHARGQLDLPRWSDGHVEAMRPLHVTFVLSAIVAVLAAAWPAQKVVSPWLASALLVVGAAAFVVTRPHHDDAGRPLARAAWVAEASATLPPGELCVPPRSGVTLSFRNGLRRSGNVVSREDVLADVGEMPRGSRSRRVRLLDPPAPEEAAWLETWRHEVSEVVLLRDRTRRIWTATRGWIERHDLCETPWPLETAPRDSRKHLAPDRPVPER
ncbi:MAG: hypothetical protein H6722_16420 [Sandaracinus sp.]|nr:hypothetical protein [Sandaracinus sp.]